MSISVTRMLARGTARITANPPRTSPTVVTGTSADGGDLDYGRLAGTPGTLVIFMGLGRLAHIADNVRC